MAQIDEKRGLEIQQLQRVLSDKEQEWERRLQVVRKAHLKPFPNLSLLCT